MNKIKTNDMVNLKTRWQDKNQNQDHTWFHYNQRDWLDKTSHNTNTLLVFNWEISTYHFLHFLDKNNKWNKICYCLNLLPPDPSEVPVDNNQRFVAMISKVQNSYRHLEPKKTALPVTQACMLMAQEALVRFVL